MSALNPLQWELSSWMDAEFCQMLFLQLLRWLYNFYLSFFLIWYITLTDFHMLNHSCDPGINPAWSCCMILLMCCWIKFVSILLEDLCLYSSEILDYSLLFLKSTFLAVVSWYYCPKNKFGVFLPLEFFWKNFRRICLNLFYHIC